MFCLGAFGVMFVVKEVFLVEVYIVVFFVCVVNGRDYRFESFVGDGIFGSYGSNSLFCG